jgi:hypothetical protein
MNETYDLPTPESKLAGCMWLPRLLFKARAAQTGALPADFTRSFGQPLAMDGQFLSFFGLPLADVIAQSERPADGDAAWFLQQPGVNAARIAEWNALAPNLGRPGFPMAQRLVWARENIYPHIDAGPSASVFEILAADEGRILQNDSPDEHKESAKPA